MRGKKEIGVKLFEMPTDCLRCSYKGDCESFENEKDKRPEDCPLRPYDRPAVAIAWELGYHEGIDEALDWLTEYEAKHGQETRLQEAIEAYREKHAR